MNTAWSEVEALVERAQSGDRDAFGELAERFQGSVYALARSRQRDEHEAAELVQEVFLHAMRKIKQLREPACFGAWLRKITVRVAINRGARRPPLPTASAEILEQGGRQVESPLEGILRRESRDAVRSAVAKLRPIDRDALVAFYLKGRSLAEIADEFDVPLGTVKRRLHVARSRLHDSMRPTVQDGREAESTPAVAAHIVAPTAVEAEDAGYVVAPPITAVDPDCATESCEEPELAVA